MMRRRYLEQLAGFGVIARHRFLCGLGELICPFCIFSLQSFILTNEAKKALF